MVALEPIDLDTGIGKLGYCPEKAYKSTRDHRLVLKPEIEHITHQIQLGGIVAYATQKVHHHGFMCLRVADV